MTEEAAPKASDSGLILRGVSWTFSAELVNQLARIGFTFVLARLLTPTEYGIAGMALVVSGFVFVFSDLGLGTAMIQRTHLSERDISTVFWASVASGAAFTVIGVGAAGLAAQVFDEPEVRDLFAVMSLTFLITSLGATQAALLTRAMDFRAIALRDFAGTFIGGAIGVYVAATGGGAWAIVAQQMTAISVSTVLLWLAVSWRPRLLISVQSLREMGGFGVTILGNRVINIVQQTTVPLLIGRFLGAQSLGFYTLANNVVLTPITRVTLPLGQVLFPAFSRHQDDPRRIGVMWLKSLSASAAITLPALAGMAVVAPAFVAVTLGSNWEELSPVIQILVVLAAMRALQGPMTAVVLALGRADMLVHISNRSRHDGSSDPPRNPMGNFGCCDYDDLVRDCNYCAMDVPRREAGARDVHRLPTRRFRSLAGHRDHGSGSGRSRRDSRWARRQLRCDSGGVHRRRHRCLHTGIPMARPKHLQHDS